ncbi:hypothetical protein B0T14DRAFT_311602 [Immersiella caudata]|uniref:Uncharacterized protein n=1 Tax=Immersiella caudata TaxID=314043 RepID=A0AA40BV12_9PEZI|nr:hypothetical protein B0T14DRAFT_311602 [Immersiella caudata]
MGWESHSDKLNRSSTVPDSIAPPPARISTKQMAPFIRPGKATPHPGREGKNHLPPFFFSFFEDAAYSIYVRRALRFAAGQMGAWGRSAASCLCFLRGRLGRVYLKRVRHVRGSWMGFSSAKHCRTQQIVILPCPPLSQRRRHRTRGVCDLGATETELEDGPYLRSPAKYRLASRSGQLIASTHSRRSIFDTGGRNPRVVQYRRTAFRVVVRDARPSKKIPPVTPVRRCCGVPEPTSWSTVDDGRKWCHDDAGGALAGCAPVRMTGAESREGSQVI